MPGVPAEDGEPRTLNRPGRYHREIVHLRLNLVRWLRAHAVILAALLLICAQIGWTAVLLAHSYFRQDDFGILDHAVASGFNWKYLTWLGGAQKGHFMPIGLAIAWALARASLYNWLLAGVVIGALVAAGSLALLRLLATLFGARPAILVPLAVYMFGPLSLGAITWWSAGLEVLPLQLAIFMAVHAHVRYLRSVPQDGVPQDGVPQDGVSRDGGRGQLRSVIAAAAWLAVGMAAADQGALVPLLLLAVTAGFFVPGRWTKAARQAVISYRRAWIVYGAVLACYCAVFFFALVSSGISPAGPGLASRLYQFAGTLIAKTALPGALGGPWRWLASGFAQAGTPAVFEYLSWAVAAAVIGVSCLYRTRAWRAWAILLAWIVAADIVPVAISGFGTLPPDSLGAQTGYLSDATAVLALCLGLAFIPLKDAAAPAPAPASTSTSTPAPPRAIPRPVRVVALLTFCAFAAGAVVSWQAFGAVSPDQASRSYIATARLAVRTAPRGTVIVDGPTPAAIMNPAFFPPSQADTARVVGALARGNRSERWTLTLDGVIADPMTFDDRGQLRQVTVLGPAAARPDSQRKTPRRSGCWDVTAAGTDIPLDGSLYRWPWTARLSYSGLGGLLAVSFGGSWNQLMVPAGNHVVYVPVVGEGNTVSVQFTGDKARALCVTGVTVGSLHPDQAGPAIPAAPVPG
jgi:hypothetical protein